MRKISSTELARMKTIALDSFNDLCDVWPYVSTSDGYTDDIPGYGAMDDDVPCGFAYREAEESERGQIVILYNEAVLSLNLTYSISVKDKVRCRGQLWQVDGVTPGYTVQIVLLKRLSADEDEVS